jgi:hypothetical protein
MVHKTFEENPMPRNLKLILALGFFAAVLTPALLIPVHGQEKQIREPNAARSGGQDV